jgi:predicted acetyltransferase
VPGLVPPTTDVRDSFLEAVTDLRSEGWMPDFPVEEAVADFDAYVWRVLEQNEGWGVPISTLWYVDGTTYLGTVVIRHRLTPALTVRGGHIGYHVAPRHRRRGHATAMLAEAVTRCHDDLDIGDVLVTCPETNLPSQRVIEANGGVLENVVDGERRYWFRRDEVARPNG